MAMVLAMAADMAGREEVVPAVSAFMVVPAAAPVAEVLAATAAVAAGDMAAEAAAWDFTDHLGAVLLL
jgi:hypothetical protein